MNREIDKNSEWMDVLSERVKEGDVQPSAELWGRIESSVRAQEGAVVLSRSRNLWLWVGGVAAAVLAAVLLLPSSLYTSETLEVIDNSEFIIADVGVESLDDSSLIEQQESVPEELGVLSVDVAQKPLTTLVEDTTDELVTVEDDDVVVDKRNEVKDPEKVKVHERSRGVYHAENNEVKVRRSQLKFSLFGSGDYLAHTTASPAGYRYQDAAYSVLMKPEGYSVGDTYQYHDAIHHQPMSLGLRAQLELMPRLSLVSGLTFTKLVSDLRLNPNSSLFDTEQKVYYLGVPLRLDYELISTGALSLYTGVGGAVEYCLGATIGGKRVKEHQWHYSVNVALGAEYKVNNWMGFYVEPELNYHLTPTKLNSMRSDASATLTLRCGLSFTL